MVIEFLTFTIVPSDRERWLEVEERTWTRFLERQPGFVRKQMWMERDRPNEVHAMICWEDEASWHAIPADQLADVDGSMGEWMREAKACRVFDVIRDC